MKRTVFFAMALFIAVCIGAGWWFLRDVEFASPVSEPPLKTTESPTEAAPVPPAGYQTYRNEEFGFEFNYPNDWIIRIPAFYSAVSLFNMAIEPRDNSSPEAVFINITPKQWIEDAHTKMRDRGAVITEIELNGKVALTTDTNEGIGGAARNYYVLIDNSFWIHISGQMRQQEVFEKILSSLAFLK
ncbi:hypothetical protein L0Y34_01940 [Candidatus Parcubacteria bacterium]|nr:hypothetical protein [Candidatus Parcubacteria bacterium]